MRGSVGLVIGLGVGAGAMYLVLRPPWGGHGGAVPSDAGPQIAVVTHDAGVVKKKGGKHHRPPAQPGQPDLPTIDSTFGGDDQPESPPPGPQMVALTGADRSSEWRGDAVALPPTKINMSSGGAEARGLDEGEIHAGISGGAGTVQQCVVSGATNTDLKATITLEMLVDGAGRVTKSRVQAPHYLQEHGILDCVRRGISKMHFNAVGGHTVVTLPVTLG